jgi:hypothetical protein
MYSHHLPKLHDPMVRFGNFRASNLLPILKHYLLYHEVQIHSLQIHLPLMVYEDPDLFRN